MGRIGWGRSRAVELLVVEVEEEVSESSNVSTPRICSRAVSRESRSETL